MGAARCGGGGAAASAAGASSERSGAACRGRHGTEEGVEGDAEGGVRKVSWRVYRYVIVAGGAEGSVAGAVENQWRGEGGNRPALKVAWRALGCARPGNGVKQCGVEGGAEGKR